MREVLDDLKVAQLPPPAAGRIEVKDEQFPQLALRVSSTGAKSWIVRCRFKGEARRITLGTIHELDADEARLRTKQLLKQCKAGKVDPAVEKKAERTEARTKRIEDERAPDLQWDRVVDRWLKHQRSRVKPSSYREIESLLRRWITPRFKSRLVTEITKADVMNLLDSVRAKTGSVYRANRCLEVIRPLFQWAALRGLVDVVPVVPGMRFDGEVSRDRVLSFEELRTIWRAIQKLDEPFRQHYAMLMILGQRRGETSRMKWADIDLEAKTWAIPAADTKASRGTVVPLPDIAIRVLGSIKHVSNPKTEREHWVFTINGATPISNNSQVDARLDRLIGGMINQDWRAHDLRRSMATHMGDIGVPPHLIKAALNHSLESALGVTAIYLRSDFALERRRAMTAWARLLSVILHRDTPLRAAFLKVLAPRTEAEQAATGEARRLIFMASDREWRRYLKGLVCPEKAKSREMEIA